VTSRDQLYITNLHVGKLCEGYIELTNYPNARKTSDSIKKKEYDYLFTYEMWHCHTVALQQHTNVNSINNLCSVLPDPLQNKGSHFWSIKELPIPLNWRKMMASAWRYGR
jgi:hypothetical protein